MPPHGSYFYIRSYLNGLVLDICGGSSDPGTPCILWPQKDFVDSINQLWYHDPHTGTIRSCLNELCLDVGENSRVCINPYDEGNPDQRWSTYGVYIINHDNPSDVLDVVQNNTEPGAEICRWQRKPEDTENRNQKWRIDYAPRLHFYIESMLNGKVVDIQAGDSDPGANIIMWSKNDGATDNQLWYTGRDGIIRSKLNGFTIDYCEGNLKTQPIEYHKEHQGFLYSDGTIRNLHNTLLVADIKAADEEDGAQLLAFEYHGGPNQKWKLVYEFNV